MKLISERLAVVQKIAEEKASSTEDAQCPDLTAYGLAPCPMCMCMSWGLVQAVEGGAWPLRSIGPLNDARLLDVVLGECCCC